MGHYEFRSVFKNTTLTYMGIILQLLGILLLCAASSLTALDPRDSGHVA